MQTDHYLDIKVLPDIETSAQVLLNNLYAKLHRALAKYGGGRIGVSFPNANRMLGDTVRLHGSKQAISDVMEYKWLGGLNDYCRMSDLRPVPEQVCHRIVKRVQAKSAHNKRKRSIAKGWMTEEEACLAITEEQQKPLKLPFIQLKSLSNGNVMRIYIAQEPPQDTPRDGIFSSYGLSSQATVPWF